MKDRRLPIPPAIDAALSSVPPEERPALEGVWRFVADAAPPVDADAAARVRAELRRLPARPAAPDRPALPKATLARRLVGALAVLLVAAVGVTFWMARPTTIMPPPGQTLRVALPGGSTVLLDTGARITYRAGLRRSVRTLRLEGRAYFTVEPGAHPFSVHTFNAAATVLGTRFEVATDASLGTTVVSVEEGRVRVGPASDPERTVVLSPGQETTVRDGGGAPLPPVEVPPPDADTWRLKTLSFVDQPLVEIAADLERKYLLEIMVPRSDLTQQRRLNYLAQRPVPIETILSDLCRTLGLKYRPTAQGYEIIHDSLR
jgi:transmembrane sensor